MEASSFDPDPAAGSRPSEEARRGRPLRPLRLDPGSRGEPGRSSPPATRGGELLAGEEARFGARGEGAGSRDPAAVGAWRRRVVQPASGRLFDLWERDEPVES
jgi:hypothetical protein